jgi:eukaryotic-like serine/threonine-protein kinase
VKLLNDRYRLEAQLGQGGMGVVYRAYDILLDRPIAVKVLSDESKDRLGTQGRARLLSEAQAAARLSHPNIVAIFDAGEAEGLPYIVMELLTGDSLFDHRPETLPEILSIAIQIASALEHAHSYGVIHRDLKPENIICQGDGKVKLTDFGLARSASSRLTAEGAIVGTVFYLAPEAALGHGTDQRSDLYALGVLLYEMVTGVLPFQGDDPLTVISQHLYSPVTPPHAHREDLPADLEKLILSLLEKDPNNRPASAKEIVDILKSIDAAAESAVKDSTAEMLMLDRITRGRMVARERELSEMKSILKKAQTGEGHVLFVSGESGIGKTRLVKELLAQAAVSGARTLSGACYSEGGVPYAPFPQLIADSFRIKSSELDLPDYALADLAAISPELRSLSPSMPPAAPLESQSDQHRLFESISTWAAAAAARQPLLIFIDDIHWADRSTIYLIRHLARRLQQNRMLVVLTYREVELQDSSPVSSLIVDLNRERLSTRIKLSRLNREETQAMLEAMLNPSGAIPAALIDAIYRETEGNPFFIEEVTKALIEEGKICNTGECWVAPPDAEIEIPQSIRQTIQSRLSRLPQPAQDMLLLASIGGRQFDFEVIREASELDEDTLIDALEAAERAQIISELKISLKGPSFTFVHGLIPATLRESTSTLRRQRLHRRLAWAIEEVFPNEPTQFETLAYHFEQGGEVEQAIHYYSQAAEKALLIYANQEAEKYCRQALEMEPEGINRARLLSVLGEALFRQSHYDQARQYWLEAIEIYRQLSDPDSVAYQYAKVGRATWYLDDAPGSLSVSLQGISEVKAMAETSGKLEFRGYAYLLHEAARAYCFNNQPSEALPLCRQALELGERLGNLEVQAETLATMGIIYTQPLEEREKYLLSAIAIAEQAGLPASAARAHMNLGAILRERPAIEEAFEHIMIAEERAGSWGNPSWQHGFLGAAAELALALGKFKWVEDIMAKMEALQGDIPNPAIPKLYARLLKSQYLRFTGLMEEAKNILLESLQDERVIGEKKIELSFLHVLTDIYMEEGQLEEALALLQNGLPNQADFMLEDNIISLRILQAFTLARLGRTQEALVELEKVNWKAPHIQSMHHEKHLKKLVHAEIAGVEGRFDEAEALIWEAGTFFGDYGLRWYQAKTYLEGSRLMGASAEIKHQESSRLLLEKAAQVFTELGLPDYVKKTIKTS